MRGSHDKRMPPELADWLALENPCWQPEYPFQGDVRQAVLDALRKSQRGLCVYCGRRLYLDRPGRFHIEHFRPQSSYPDLSLDLANLFLSCGPEEDAATPSETCGHAKGAWFDEAGCIEPDYPTCTRRFRFLLSGEVAPRTDDDAAAGTMIQLLNLNHRELRKEREDIFDRIEREGLDRSDFVEPVSGMAESYAHAVCERLGTVIP